MKILGHPKTRFVRPVFISDLHLGFRHSRVRELLNFLMTHEPENLYLVGDFIDGWSLQKRWHWQPECNLIVARLRGCHGVICGHLHAPQQLTVDGLTYCNTGDWVENCTALIEDHQGRVQLVWLDGVAAEPGDEMMSSGAAAPCLAHESVPVSA